MMKQRIMSVVFSVYAETGASTAIETIMLVIPYPAKEALWLRLTERELERLANDGRRIPDDMTINILFSDTAADAEEQIKTFAPDVVFDMMLQPDETSGVHDSPYAQSEEDQSVALRSGFDGFLRKARPGGRVVRDPPAASAYPVPGTRMLSRFSDLTLSSYLVSIPT